MRAVAECDNVMHFPYVQENGKRRRKKIEARGVFGLF